MNINFKTKQKDLPFSILLNVSFWWTAAWWVRLVVQRRIFWYIWKQQKSSLHNSCNPNSSLSQTLFLPRSLLWCRYKHVDLKINKTYKLKIEYVGKYIWAFKKSMKCLVRHLKATVQNFSFSRASFSSLRGWHALLLHK
jgi:hypothetical protein